MQGGCQGGPSTYMLGGLKVDDDQSAATALGGQWQVPTGPDLQGGAQRDGQVCVPGVGRWGQTGPRPRGLCSPPPTPGGWRLRGLQNPHTWHRPHCLTAPFVLLQHAQASPGRLAHCAPISALKARPQAAPISKPPKILPLPLPFCLSHIPTQKAEAFYTWDPRIEILAQSLPGWVAFVRMNLVKPQFPCL